MLEKELSFEKKTIELKLRRGQSTERGLETAILVALIGGGAGVLTTLINALISLYGNRKQGIIKIRTHNGDELEFPIDTPRERINEFLEVHGELSVEKIKIFNRAGEAYNPKTQYK